MPKYKVGDLVWYAKCRPELVEKTCPTCFGKKKVTLILGNGDRVVLPCGGCAPGCANPRGFIKEYEHVAGQELVIITKISVEVSREGEKSYYHSSQGSFSEEDLFPSSEEAAARTTEKKKDLEEEQAKKAECIKEKVHKSFSWNAYYHMREAKKCRKQAEYHDSMAVLCRVRSGEEEK